MRRWKANCPRPGMIALPLCTLCRGFAKRRRSVVSSRSNLRMMWKADFGTACGWTQEHAPRISALTFESAAGDVLSFLPALPTLFASENSPANSARMRLRRITSSMCGPQGNEVFNFARVIVRPCHKHIQAARRSRRWEHHNSSDGALKLYFFWFAAGSADAGALSEFHISRT